jgi:hypothetical protein
MNDFLAAEKGATRADGHEGNDATSITLAVCGLSLVAHSPSTNAARKFTPT